VATPYHALSRAGLSAGESAFVARGRLNLDYSATHTLPLQDINTGLDMLRKGEGNPVRIVVTFN